MLTGGSKTENHITITAIPKPGVTLNVEETIKVTITTQTPYIDTKEIDFVINKAHYKNTTTEKRYSTLSKALADSATNTQIDVIEDITETIDSNLSNKTIILNLNGHTITATPTNSFINILNNGNLTIIGSGEIKSTNNKETIKNTQGVLNVQSGKINGENTAIVNESTLNINGGIITAKVYGITNTGTVVFNNGTIMMQEQSDVDVGIYNKDTSGSITIKGGTINGKSYGIYNVGTTTIMGGTITGQHPTIGCITNGSTLAILTITGGTITSSRTIGNSGTVIIGDSTKALDRTEPIITATNGYAVYDYGQFEFYGGKLIGTNNGTEYLYNNELDKIRSGYEVVSFPSNTAGYYVTTLGDNSYVVSTAGTLCTIGGREYYKYTNDKAFAGIIFSTVAIDPYTAPSGATNDNYWVAPFLVSTSPNGVKYTTNHSGNTVFEYWKSFVYDGKTYYYTSAQFAMGSTESYSTIPRLNTPETKYNYANYASYQALFEQAARDLLDKYYGKK